MKKIFITALSFITLAANAQKIVNQAVITTKSNMISDEVQEDISNIGGNGGGGRFAGFDGETKSITYYKDSMSKTVIKNEMMNSNIIRNNNSKVTTMLMEMMGSKLGFYSNDNEVSQMAQKRLDTMQAGPRKDSILRKMENDKKRKSTIVYTEETKKIAGYDCKKAYLVTTNFLGQKDSSMIWYTPEIKLPGLANTMASMGFGRPSGGGNVTNFDDVNGFVMAYTQRLGATRRMEVEVSKIELDKEIKVKEFDIPKDYDVKPMSEMRNMFGGGAAGQGGGSFRIQRSQ